MRRTRIALWQWLAVICLGRALRLAERLNDYESVKEIYDGLVAMEPIRKRGEREETF